MRYVAFIWTKWDSDADVDPAEFGRYAEFNASSADAGVRVQGRALHPVSSATTVPLR